MKKIFMILLSTIIAAAALSAQETSKTVAVKTFDVVGDCVTKDDAEAITELYISSLVSTGKVTIFSRKDFDTMLAEMQFQSGDWSSKEKTVQLQKATGATVLGRGQIFKLGSSFYISATMIDANTAEILSASKKSFKSIDEVVELLDAMAKEISTSISKVVMKYKIGDTGPGGGLVFYVSEEGFEVFDGKGGVQKCNYLEVTKEELACVRWSPTDSNSVQGATGLGYGKANTYKIVSYFSNANSSNCAAYVCYKYNNANTSAGEWFLPSKDELNLMYVNLCKEDIGDFDEDSYWSSSETDFSSDYAWRQQFYGVGQQSYGTRDYAHRMRPVRAF